MRPGLAGIGKLGLGWSGVFWWGRWDLVLRKVMGRLMGSNRGWMFLGVFGAVLLAGMGPCGDAQGLEVDRLAQGQPQIVAGRSQGEPTFLDWCVLPRKSITLKSVVEAVFKATGTKRCAEAANRLGQMKELNLKGMKVQDLRPLGRLPNLTRLVLDHTPLQSLRGMLNLPNLEVLSLRNSSIQQLEGIEQLRKLKVLAIDGSFVKDLGPVAGLKELRQLSAQRNRIRDLSPLVELRNLQILALRNNLIEDITPLAFLNELQELYLDDNLIRDLRPLSGLHVLRTLTLNDNLVQDFKILMSLPSLNRVELLGMPVKENPCPTMFKKGVCSYHQTSTGNDATRSLR